MTIVFSYPILKVMGILKGTTTLNPFFFAGFILGKSEIIISASCFKAGDVVPLELIPLTLPSFPNTN
jgi:hypothetical protein